MKLKFWQKSLKPKDIFTKDQLADISETVREAELMTSGEIRVVMRSTCERGLDSRQQALADFKKHRLTRTKDKTGVLILVVLQERTVEILGDKGINDKVSESFWESVVSAIISNFKNDEFHKGICTGVEMVGRALAKHFPRKPDDTNELPNEPVLEP